MTDTQIIDLLQHNIESFNSGDFDEFGRTLSEEGTYEEVATGRVSKTRDEELQLTRGWRNAFPDVKGRVKNIFASGDQGAAEIVWEGTHTGDLEGPEGKIPATGKRISVPASMMVKVKDGHIAESHHYFDMQTLMRQLQG